MISKLITKFFNIYQFYKWKKRWNKGNRIIYSILFTFFLKFTHKDRLHVRAKSKTNHVIYFDCNFYRYYINYNDRLENKGDDKINSNILL